MNTNLKHLDIDIIYKAFPNSLKADIDNLYTRFNFLTDSYAISNDKVEVLVNKERVEIPYRIYLQELKFVEDELLSDAQKNILFCLLTRNSDGFVREEYLKKLLQFHEYWISPYLVLLLGEYIYKIHLQLYENMDIEWVKLLKNLFLENPNFYAKTNSKVISYWNCYYRDITPNYLDYPGYKLLLKIISS